MFSSHNLRMLNPAISQTPLLQGLTVKVPDFLICSKTVKIRNFVWIDGYDQFIPTHEFDRVSEINQKFHQTGQMDPDSERVTEVTDPLTKCINIRMGAGQFDQLASITVVPCCGLYHEVIEREKKHHSVMLTPQLVELKPERYLAHGRMIEQNKGVLKSFNIPAFDRINHSYGAPLDQKYIVMMFDIKGVNVATGMLGVGLPPVATLGVFFDNFFSKLSHPIKQVPFAVGLENLQPLSSRGTLYNRSYQQSNQRKSNIKGCFVFKPYDSYHAEQLMRLLSQDFEICGARIHNKSISFTDHLPKAYWMHDMSSEVQQRLKLCPDTDALDIAFELTAENRLFSTVSSGFALFDHPQQKPHMDTIRYGHAWAESVFSCTELVLDDFKENFLYRRICLDRFVSWAQNIGF